MSNFLPVTDGELKALGETLWSLDTNSVFHLIRVNTQGVTTSTGRDNAPKPLLTVSPEAYEKPTIKKLIALQDNYIPEVRTKEHIPPQERIEETEFLDAVTSTPVMQKAEEFLRAKGYIGRMNNNGGKGGNLFRDTLREIWFGMYSRQNSVLGSSGFEHIFIGEIKNGEISGFHNWIYFARQEKHNHVNYNGHMRTIRLGSTGMVLKYHFKWDANTKPVNTMFIGTSPEFEMAVYTVCFYTRPGTRCPLTFGGKSVRINTHYFFKSGKRYVASAFPEI